MMAKKAKCPPCPLGFNLHYIISLVLQVFICFALCNCNSTEIEIEVMDMKTPRNVHLSAIYKKSFAYHTVKNRMPVIVTQVVDSLTRYKDDIVKEYGPEAQEEIKTVISDISKLKYEIQTNKELRNITTNAPDTKFYNEYIEKCKTKNGETTFFSTIWLLSECYMYRRIREAFESTKSLTQYDPFRKQKQEAFHQSEPLMANLGQYLTEISKGGSTPVKEDFMNLMKANLWGNKCDLSFSNGVQESHDVLLNITQLDPYILSNHSEKIWEAIVDKNATSNTIDIILDNSGYEVFCDLSMADYLLTKNLASHVRFYVKSIPWFISDVMLSDFNWVIEELKQHSNPVLQELGIRWKDHLTNNRWSIEESNFWTLPVDFSAMPVVDPGLYKKLGEAKLLVFKGDLNYRKLFGEKNWAPTTPLEEALQGFNPARLCTLRTMKADIVCGLDEGVAEKTEAVDQDWMITGKYGLMQYCGLIRKLD